SHTVLLAKPEKAHFTASLAGLNLGSASSFGPNNVQRDSSAPSVTAITPTAAGGSGSSTSAATMPANRAKKLHAFAARPGGGGNSHKTSETATGMPHRHQTSADPRACASRAGAAAIASTRAEGIGVAMIGDLDTRRCGSRE